MLVEFTCKYCWYIVERKCFLRVLKGVLFYFWDFGILGALTVLASPTLNKSPHWAVPVGGPRRK